MTYDGTFFICDVSTAVHRAKNTDLEAIDYSNHVKEETQKLAKLEKRLEQSELGDKIRHAQNLSFMMTQSALLIHDEDPRKIQSMFLGTDIDGYIVRKWIPEYLENNTEKGGDLWKKLIGMGDKYILQIRDKEFEMRGNGGCGGFLNQKEIKELKKELGKLEITSKDIETEKYDTNKSDFVKYGGLERIYEMCSKAASRNGTILLYVGPH